jgi:YggT family protein
MPTLIKIATYLVETLFSLYLLAVLIRFLLQQVRADFYNPISQFFVKATNPALKPLRRVIPGWGGIDFASIVLAFLVELIAIYLLTLVSGYNIFDLNPVRIIGWAIVGVLSFVVNFYFFAVIVAIIVSWVAPQSYHPAIILLHQLTQPVMAPFRRILPPLGGLDLSPILVFIVINILRMVLAGTQSWIPFRLVPGLG